MESISREVDGSRIRALVENEGSFSRYIDKQFDALDADHDGLVTQKQLKPVVETLGGAVGLPPIGTSPESDHIYDEIFSEFTNGAPVKKQVFRNVLESLLLGLADGLERDPISVMRMDGSTLRSYIETGEYEVDMVSIFTRLDVKQEGRLPVTSLMDALPSISVHKGMPPSRAPKVLNMVEEATRNAGVDNAEDLDQMEFVDALREVLRKTADALKSHPLDVAHSEKRYDGQSIRKLLGNPNQLQQVIDQTWSQIPKDHHHKVSKDYLRASLDEVAPYAGLPPIGSVDEFDEVVREIYEKFQLIDGKKISKEEFCLSIKEVLGSLLLALEGKPIATESSKVLDADDGSLKS